MSKRIRYIQKQEHILESKQTFKHREKEYKVSINIDSMTYNIIINYKNGLEKALHIITGRASSFKSLKKAARKVLTDQGIRFK